MASWLRSAGPLGPSTAASAAVAFLTPAGGYRQWQAGRRPGAALAADREAVSACLDFLMAAVSSPTGSHPLGPAPCAGTAGLSASACLVVAVPQVAVDQDDAHWPVEAPAVELVPGGAPCEGVSACGVPAVGGLAAPRDHLGRRARVADEDPQPRVAGFACRRDHCLGGTAGRARGSSRFTSPPFPVPGGQGSRASG